MEKLVQRLIHNHNLTREKALQYARSAIERAEKRLIRTPSAAYKALHVETFGYNPDYTQACLGSSGGGLQCGQANCLPRVRPSGCFQTTACTGTCDCLAPLPNSHQVSDGCVCSHPCSNFGELNCPELAGCECAGLCGYDCDAGYSWNPVTLSCDLIPITGAGLSPGGITVLFACGAGFYRRKKALQRKKRIYYTLFCV